MNAIDRVTEAARAEARRMRVLRRREDAEVYETSGKALPYIVIERGASGRLRASGGGHAGHDNEGRMPFVCDWLQRRVLPLVDPEADVRGIYRIELHDSYSYLPDQTAHENALVFGRPRGARDSVALFPDPYLMDDFGGALLQVRDTVPWARKRPTLFFAGTTTGHRDPVKNERVRACVWSLDQPDDVASFHLTQIAQMSADQLVSAVPRAVQTFHHPYRIEEHFAYRYLVNIVGNSACWSRLPMIMASGSLMLNLRHSDLLWYYPMLAADVHFVEAASLDDLLQKRSFCMANDAWCQHVVGNANRFVQEYVTSSMAAAYAVQLLESMEE